MKNNQEPQVKILGIGSRIGSKKISLADIANRFGKDVQTINRKCGAENLYHIDDSSESLMSLGTLAIEDSLTRSGLSLQEISGIFASSSSFGGDTLIPGPARSLGKYIGLKEGIMLSLSMGCAGGLNALNAAYNQLCVDQWKGKTTNYLVVSGDQTSRVLDPNLWETSPLFSDGIAALVISNDPKLFGYRIEKIGEKAIEGDIYAMRLRNHFAFNGSSPNHHPIFFEMQGKETYEFAARLAYPTILDILELNEMPQNAYFIPHQASKRIVNSISEYYNLDKNRVYTDGTKIGNTTGASTFIGLEDTLRRGLSNKCDQIILGAYGAELQVAATLIKKEVTP